MKCHWPTEPCNFMLRQGANDFAANQCKKHRHYFRSLGLAFRNGTPNSIPIQFSVPFKQKFLLSSGARQGCNQA